MPISKNQMKIVALTATSASAGLVTLTPDNFNQVKEEGNYLVKFYAPWCGHCKQLAPEYQAAADIVEDVQLGEVDCDAEENKPLCSEYGVQGFPTLKWFGKDCNPVEYDGGRTKDTILQWVEDILKPAVQEADAVPEVGDRLQVVLEAPEISEDFDLAANKNRKHAVFVFVKTDGAAKVTVLRKGDEPVVLDDVSAVGLDAAVDTYRFPYFGELNGETYGDYTGRQGKKMLWTLLKDYDAEAVDAIREDFEALAKDFSDYSFTYTDTVQFASPIESMLGVTEFPAVVVQDGAKKYILKDDISKSAVKKFLNGVEAGSVEATIKSEEIPESQDKAVRVVVAKSLEDELFNDKDVLLKVYAPWCGHCKALAPDYDAAAEALPDLVGDKVVLAKIDGTLNDSTVDGLEWSGFPTLVFVKAGSKDILKYDGPRNKEGILEWIAEKSDQADVKALTKEKIADALAKEAENAEDAEDDKETDEFHRIGTRVHFFKMSKYKNVVVLAGLGVPSILMLTGCSENGEGYPSYGDPVDSDLYRDCLNRSPQGFAIDQSLLCKYNGKTNKWAGSADGIPEKLSSAIDSKAECNAWLGNESGHCGIAGPDGDSKSCVNSCTTDKSITGSDGQSSSVYSVCVCETAK
eukprot:gene879-103_t